MLKGGMPQATTIRESDIPEAVARVKAEIRRILNPTIGQPPRFSLAIDGGSSKLANGVKLITVIVSSPSLPADAVLGIELRMSHEDSVSQAELLVELLNEYGLSEAEAVYLVGDNASVNKATADLLRNRGAYCDSCLMLRLVPSLGIHVTSRWQVQVDEAAIRPLPPSLPESCREGVHRPVRREIRLHFSPEGS